MQVCVVASSKFSDSKNFEAFKDWRNKIVKAVKKAAWEWCHRDDIHAVVHYIDSGPGPWSLLLREGWSAPRVGLELSKQNSVENVDEESFEEEFIVNMLATAAT